MHITPGTDADGRPFIALKATGVGEVVQIGQWYQMIQGQGGHLSIVTIETDLADGKKLGEVTMIVPIALKRRPPHSGDADPACGSAPLHPDEEQP